MTSNVVPTRIINKLGISTVVYKSVDKSPKARSGQEVPPPSVTPEFREPKKTGNKGTDEVNMYLYYKVRYASKSRRVQDRLMATLHGSTTEVIGRTMGVTVPEAFAPAVEWCMKARSFNLLNNLAAIPLPDGERSGKAMKHLQAVHGLDHHDPQVSLAGMSEGEIEPYRALVLALKGIRGREIEAVSERGETGAYQRLRNPELTDFILRNHERVDDIIDLVNSGERPFDPEVYESILNSPARSLRDGIL
jgi:hypothetical protein